MSEPFLGEIQLFAFNFAPRQWAQCQGQLMPLNQYTALFSLLGNIFGGDGQHNFALPNFSGSAACAQGQGNGLTPRTVGESFGSESVTLLGNQMPSHTHGARVYNQRDTSKRHGIPAAGDAVVAPATLQPFVAASPDTAFPPNVVGASGGGLPHENRQPYLAVNFCIALAGAYPSRP
ncbi:phage tail protein [Frateuria defendens]|uniref:phage tail protein n=1 Tax=Frateuria defendens TaxID=2219559 RepID=UPI00066FE5FF|nr:tail fiber protein [Frateuria defendens]